MIPASLITNDSLDQLVQALRHPVRYNGMGVQGTGLPRGPQKRANRAEQESNWRGLVGDTAVIGDAMLLANGGKIPRLPIHARALQTKANPSNSMRRWYLWAVRTTSLVSWNQNDMRRNYRELWVESGCLYQQVNICYGVSADMDMDIDVLSNRCRMLALLHQLGILPECPVT